MTRMTDAELNTLSLNIIFTNPDELIKHKSLFMSKKGQWEYLLTIVNGRITWYEADDHYEALNDGAIMCIQDNYIEYLDVYDERDDRIEPARDNMDFVNQFNNKD